MNKTIRLGICCFLFFSSLSGYTQTWVDSVEMHGREVYMSADKYKWDWGQATFLNSLIHLYNSKPVSEKNGIVTLTNAGKFIQTSAKVTAFIYRLNGWYEIPLGPNKNIK